MTAALNPKSLCDNYIDVRGWDWIGTYCKLPAGHDGPCSAHYPAEAHAPSTEEVPDDD